MTAHHLDKNPQDQASTLALPVAFAVALAALGGYVGFGGVAGRSILAAAVFLVLWSGVVFGAARRGGRRLTIRPAVLKPHWAQACTQASLYAYWAFFVPSIRIYWSLILAQILFAYGFHILLTWSRQDEYGLGFGPLPITLSVNLFLLFKPEWFYWQFGILAIGFLAKEFIRWNRDGRSVHVFNPSSFPLVVYSVALIVTGRTDVTLGVEIASVLFNPPHMHALLFLVSLPVQLMFGVATMTIAAVVTTYVFGLAYFELTGTYLFFDAYVPIAVFLGMHLLITDPSTSPRSGFGRVVFGILYALATMATFGLLRLSDQPAFYDKLLPVVLVNLLVPFLDNASERMADRFGRISQLGAGLSEQGRRTAVVGVWAALFMAMSYAGGLGDEHPGQWVPFWEQACAEGSARGCEHFAVLQQGYCLNGSGWACNELANYLARINDRSEALAALRRGCSLGYPEACGNLEAYEGGSGALVRGRPLVPDLPIILRGSKGPVLETNVVAMYDLACKRGFASACG